MAAYAIAAAVLPNLVLIAAGHLVGEIPAAARDAGSARRPGHRLVVALGVTGAAYAAALVLGPVQSSLSSVVKWRLVTDRGCRGAVRLELFGPAGGEVSSDAGLAGVKPGVWRSVLGWGWRAAPGGAGLSPVPSLVANAGHHRAVHRSASRWSSTHQRWRPGRLVFAGAAFVAGHRRRRSAARPRTGRRVGRGGRCWPSSLVQRAQLQVGQAAAAIGQLLTDGAGRRGGCCGWKTTRRRTAWLARARPVAARQRSRAPTGKGGRLPPPAVLARGHHAAGGQLPGDLSRRTAPPSWTGWTRARTRRARRSAVARRRTARGKTTLVIADSPACTSRRRVTVLLGSACRSADIGPGRRQRAHRGRPSRTVVAVRAAGRGVAVGV